MAKKHDEQGLSHKTDLNVVVARPESVDGFFTYCDEVVGDGKKSRYCTVLASRATRSSS